MSAWAADNDAGEHAYVITKKLWGRTRHQIYYASSLADAKRRYAWTREQHTSVTVRRARPEDVTE